MRWMIMVAVALAGAACAAAPEEKASAPPEKPPVASEPVGPMTPWIRSQLDWLTEPPLEWYKPYGNAEGVRRQSVGWGTGNYLGEKLEFFAFLDRHGLMQMHLSASLDKVDRDRIDEMAPIRFGDWWSADDVPAKGADRARYGPGTRTWIGLSLSWIEPCGENDLMACTDEGLDEYLVRLNDQMQGRLQLTLTAHLP